MKDKKNTLESRRLEAMADLNSAFEHLSDASLCHFRKMVDEAEENLSGSMRSLTSTIANSFGSIDSDFGVSKSIRSNPFNWGLLATAVGGTAGIFMALKPVAPIPRSTPDGDGDARRGTSLKRWGLMALDVGLVLINERIESSHQDRVGRIGQI